MHYFTCFFFISRDFADLHEICGCATAQNIRSPVCIKFMEELLSGIATSFITHIGKSSQTLSRCTIQRCIMFWILRNEYKLLVTPKVCFFCSKLPFLLCRSVVSYRTLTKPLHSFESLNAASGGEGF